MSEFFEVPAAAAPARSESRAYRQPPWLGPPRGSLPGVVAAELVLAATDEVAIAVSRLGVHRTGFEFELRIMVSPDVTDPERFDPMLIGPYRRARMLGGGPPVDHLLRFGVQFADGGKATNLDRPRPGAGGEPPAGPVLHAGGGGGGGGAWRYDHWVWPLPPPGPVAFVCEWPAVGIELSRREINARIFHDAASRAQVIFPDDHLPDWPGTPLGRVRPAGR